MAGRVHRDSHYVVLILSGEESGQTISPPQVDIDNPCSVLLAMNSEYCCYSTMALHPYPAKRDVDLVERPSQEFN